VKQWSATPSTRDAAGVENRSEAAKIRKNAFFVHATVFVMPAHSRSKNGVASLAYVAGIHVFTRASNQRPKTWMAGTSPAMTVGGARHHIHFG
jgi:hypothetical protein